MHTRRMVVSVLALCALFVSVWSLPEAVASDGAREPARPLAEMTLSASRIDWQSAADSEHLTLTVAGPEGLWIRRDFEAGQPASLSLSDPEWERLADGSYTWELRVVSPPGKLPQKPAVESGHFFVKDGSFVAPRQKASAAPPRPPRLLTAEDFIEDGNMVVIGNACIGETCTNNDDDYSALRLKAPQPNLLFDDDFVEGGSSPHDWAVLINPGTAAAFSIADFENQLIPFTIAGGAPNSSVYVAANGDLGLGTATPGEKVHVFENVDANTLLTVENPNTGLSALGGVRAKSDSAITSFQAHGSGRTLSRFGQTLASWAEFLQVTGNGLIIGTLPDKPLILGTNNSNRLHISGNGNVGIGTSSPASKLHVSSSDGSTSQPASLFEETNGTTAFRTMLELKNNGASRLNFTDSSVGNTWGINNNSGNVNMIRSGTGGILAFSLQPNGNLTIAGTLTQGSDRATKRDIAPVQPEEILAKVANLPITTWNRKTDPPSVRHMGPMAQDFAAIFGLGDDDRHIATLDMDGVSLASIQALYRMSTAKDAEIAELRRENADLAQRLAAIEALVLQSGRKNDAASVAQPTP